VGQFYFGVLIAEVGQHSTGVDNAQRFLDDYFPELTNPVARFFFWIDRIKQVA
jgi:hypothetical protein